jgi:hypothetical protein
MLEYPWWMLVELAVCMDIKMIYLCSVRSHQQNSPGAQSNDLHANGNAESTRPNSKLIKQAERPSPDRHGVATAQGDKIQPLHSCAVLKMRM